MSFSKITQENFFYLLGLQTASSDYADKMKASTANDKTLFNLGWRVDEFSRLNEAGRKMIVEVRCLIEFLSDEQCDLIALNATIKLCALQKCASSFLKNLYSYY